MNYRTVKLTAGGRLPGAVMPAGSRWVFDGDSITINSLFTSGGVQDHGASWTTSLARRSNGRIRHVYNAGVGGQNSAGALARFDAFVAVHQPDVVFLSIGVNDAPYVPIETWQSNLKQYKKKVDAIGATLVLGPLWPSDNPTYAATFRTWNKWLYEWASSVNVKVVPWDRLADPVTGGWRSGWSTDGTHPIPSVLATIGAFGWRFLEPFVSASGIREPVASNVDAVSNGFFTNTVSMTAVAPTATTSTASGALPAGAYEYKMTALGFMGETAASPSSGVISLGAPGQITLTLVAPQGNAGRRIYRKGPGDATFRFLAEVAPSGTYVDDGAASPSSRTAPSIATDARPTGFSPGSLRRYRDGAGVTTDLAVRGNVLRLTPYTDDVSSAEFFDLFTVAPGDLWEFSVRVRARSTVGAVQLRFYTDATEATGAGTFIMLNQQELEEWGLEVFRMTVPPTATRARFVFTCQTGPAGSYVDFAELHAEKVS
jgi:lysophospholipase L1-like esterase